MKKIIFIFCLLSSFHCLQAEIGESQSSNERRRSSQEDYVSFPTSITNWCDEQGRRRVTFKEVLQESNQQKIEYFDTDDKPHKITANMYRSLIQAGDNLRIYSIRRKQTISLTTSNREESQNLVPCKTVP